MIKKPAATVQQKKGIAEKFCMRILNRIAFINSTHKKIKLTEKRKTGGVKVCGYIVAPEKVLITNQLS